MVSNPYRGAAASATRLLSRKRTQQLNQFNSLFKISRPRRKLKKFRSYVPKSSVVPTSVVLSASLVNFCRYKAQKGLGTEEGISPKR